MDLNNLDGFVRYLAEATDDGSALAQNQRSTCRAEVKW